METGSPPGQPDMDPDARSGKFLDALLEPQPTPGTGGTAPTSEAQGRPRKNITGHREDANASTTMARPVERTTKSPHYEPRQLMFTKSHDRDAPG